MKKFLYLLLALLCLPLLASVAFASVNDGIRGAPAQQDREGSYAAPLPVAAQPSIETAFLPQSSIFVASANETFITTDKGAVTVSNDVIIAIQSGVPAPAIKDSLASSFVSGQKIKTANAPMAIIAHTTPATIPMKEEVRSLNQVRPGFISLSLENNTLFRAIAKTG